MNLLHEKKLPDIPGYDIREKIAEGGIGTVYKGVQLSTDQTVAIKIIAARASTCPKSRQRAEREFRSANRLVHPNIVQALDFIREESKLYLVMEYVDGLSLGEHVERHGPLTESAAVAVIAQVGQALHFMHSHDMIHRDIKPDNILVTKDGKAKLTDFGLVKESLSNAHLTGPMVALGTPQFMAPEQYTEARLADHRCDIYAMAATLYVAVTGRLPFGATRSLATLMQKVNKGQIVPPREIQPELSERIEAAIRKGMCPDPAGRPRSCLEFVKLLIGKGGRRRASSSRPSGGSRALPKLKTAEPNSERRAAVRYPLGVASDCVVETSLHDREADANNQWPATVEDLSSSGLALVLARRVERGTILVVDLEGANGRTVKSLQAKVVRLQARGFGQWLVGCQLLEPLSPEEVQFLV
jgi:serine/threonine protein kinase